MRSLFLLLIMVSFAANAEVYKWVDEEGNVQYGDKPTSDKSEPVKMRNDMPKGVDPKEELDKKREIMQYSPEERQKREQEKAAQQKNLDKECADAKERLVKYKAAPVLMETDDQKRSVPLSAEQRLAAIAELEKKIQELCTAK